jgi:alpha-1,2-mannosyltransferase
MVDASPLHEHTRGVRRRSTFARWSEAVDGVEFGSVEATAARLGPVREQRSLIDVSAGPFVLVGAAVSLLTLYLIAKGPMYGFDFRGGAWPAGRNVLAGRSPYPDPDPVKLLVAGNAYIPPPPLAVLCVPLSILPFVPAVVALGVACTAALVAALWIVGARDWRVYGLALTSLPFVASIAVGQPDGLLALGIALAWRYRSSRRGAAAVGVVIALKLLAWPLLAWLLVTRRFRQAAFAAAVAAATVVGTWALIGFEGLSQYPRLLEADAEAFQKWSHSMVAAALRLGAPGHAARLLAIGIAAGVAFAVFRLASDRDLGAFTAALAFGLLASPIVWTHYLVVLFVPLAVAHQRAADGAWLLTIPFWLSPLDPPRHLSQVFLVLALAAALSVLGARPAGASGEGELVGEPVLVRVPRRFGPVLDP